MGKLVLVRNGHGLGTLLHHRVLYKALGPWLVLHRDHIAHRLLFHHGLFRFRAARVGPVVTAMVLATNKEAAAVECCCFDSPIVALAGDLHRTANGLFAGSDTHDVFAFVDRARIEVPDGATLNDNRLANHFSRHIHQTYINIFAC